MILKLLLTFIFSFLSTSLFVAPTIALAKRFKLLDNPKIRPHPAHIQKRTVPRAGGLACFLGIILSLGLFVPLDKAIFGMIIGLFILLLVGLADDRYNNLSPYFRLFSQFVASLMVVLSGVDIKFVTNPLGGIIYFDAFVGTLLAIIWIVWVINMINWSKGVDGQMPGITTVAAGILGVLSLKLALFGDPTQEKVATLAAITAGASAGLLIFNWYPAKIFPGFSGSGVLGFMIAVLAILSGAKLATAILVLLIPATDFIYTFIRRILSGKSPVWGDRGHLHHKLLQLGFSHQKISLFYILGSVILGTAALSLNSAGKIFAVILLGTTILGAILWLNFFGGLSKQPGPDNG